MSAPRRMKGLKPVCNEHFCCMHNEEHDHQYYGSCEYHGCTPVVDLDALADGVERLQIVVAGLSGDCRTNASSIKGIAERTDAIEAEMPRIRLVERRTADLEAVAWGLGIPKKPAEPEQMICEKAGKCAYPDCDSKTPHICPALPHNRSILCLYCPCDCIPLSEFNRRKEAEKAKQDAERMMPNPKDTSSHSCEHDRNNNCKEHDCVSVTEARAAWDRSIKVGATVEILEYPACACGCTQYPAKSRQVISSLIAWPSHPNDKSGHVRVNIDGLVCYKCARVIPEAKRCPTCGHELHKEK